MAGVVAATEMGTVVALDTIGELVVDGCDAASTAWLTDVSAPDELVPVSWCRSAESPAQTAVETRPATTAPRVSPCKLKYRRSLPTRVIVTSDRQRNSPTSPVAGQRWHGGLNLNLH